VADVDVAPAGHEYVPRDTARAGELQAACACGWCEPGARHGDPAWVAAATLDAWQTHIDALVPDFAHTPKAEASRRRKARALVDAAIALGLADEDLLPAGGHRAEVVKAAGVKTPHDDDTWFVVHELMTERTAR